MPVAPFFREETQLVEELGVDLRLGEAAEELDTAARRIKLASGHVHYDALVIATGGRARRLSGTAALDGVHTLRTLDDAVAVRAALKSGPRTVVIGAGFIGSEIASTARRCGAEVTVVEAASTPLVRAVGERMGGALAALHTRHGTTLLCGVGVRSLEGGSAVERVVLDDGRKVPADLVVVGVGIDPAVEWLGSSGLTLDNGVCCDETLWTGAAGVFAAGDVANWPNAALDGVRHRTENWTAAAEQGARAAYNAIDPTNAKSYATVPYFWSDWYGLRIQMVGTPEADDVEMVEGAIDDNRWVALYRRADRLVGALTLQGQTEIMKYRGLIAKGASWSEGLGFAASRRRSRSAV